MVARASSFVPRKSRTNYSRNRDVRYIKTNSTCTQLEKKSRRSTIHAAVQTNTKMALSLCVCACVGVCFFSCRVWVSQRCGHESHSRDYYILFETKNTDSAGQDHGFCTNCAATHTKTDTNPPNNQLQWMMIASRDSSSQYIDIGG